MGFSPKIPARGLVSHRGTLTVSPSWGPRYGVPVMASLPWVPRQGPAIAPASSWPRAIHTGSSPIIRWCVADSLFAHLLFCVFMLERVLFFLSAHSRPYSLLCSSSWPTASVSLWSVVVGDGGCSAVAATLGASAATPASVRVAGFPHSGCFTYSAHLMCLVYMMYFAYLVCSIYLWRI